MSSLLFGMLSFVSLLSLVRKHVKLTRKLMSIMKREPQERTPLDVQKVKVSL